MSSRMCRARFANAGNEFGVPTAVKNANDKIAYAAFLGESKFLKILLGLLIEINDSWGQPAADGNFAHVDVRSI